MAMRKKCFWNKNYDGELKYFRNGRGMANKCSWNGMAMVKVNILGTGMAMVRENVKEVGIRKVIGSISE